MANEIKMKSKVKLQGGAQLPAESASKALKLDSSGNISASTTTDAELAFLSGVTSSVQTQIGDAQADATQALSDAADASTAISDHLSDSVDAHDASAISSIAAGNLAATDVQTALNELQSDIDSRALQSALQAHLDDAVDAHDASAISSIPSGNLAATDVQGALDELQSDVDSRALDSVVIKKNGSVAFTADQSMGGFKLTGLAAPSAGSDAATKNYVDNALEGLKPKAAVRAATTIAGTIASSFEDGDVIDGVTLATGDRILIKDQAAPAQNGIYIVQASGAPVRSTDFDSVSPVDEINKAFVATQEGTSNAGKIFVQYGVVTTVGTDAINFTFFNSVSGLTGGDGITVSGSNIEVDHDGQGLTFVATQLALELDGSTLSKSASGIKLSDTAVTPGSNGSATQVSTFTVDQQGRLTAAGQTSIAIPASQVTDFTEAAQDAVGGALTDSDTIDFTYNDGANTITAAAKTQMSITSDASGLKLSGDASTPGNSKYYGTDGAGAKGFHSFVSGSSGDIAETSFSIANNQVSAANVTGFAFSTTVVRGFQALVTVEIDGTADLFETFELTGINKAGSFEMAQSGVGDESGVVFSITVGGQIQYTSASYAGFVEGKIKFRAITTTYSAPVVIASAVNIAWTRVNPSVIQFSGANGGLIGGNNDWEQGASNSTAITADFILEYRVKGSADIRIGYQRSATPPTGGSNPDAGIRIQSGGTGNTFGPFTVTGSRYDIPGTTEKSFRFIRVGSSITLSIDSDTPTAFESFSGSIYPHVAIFGLTSGGSLTYATVL